MLKVKFINLQSKQFFLAYLKTDQYQGKKGMHTVLLMYSDKCFLIIGLKCSWSWIIRKCFWPNVGNCFVPLYRNHSVEEQN